MSQNSDHPQAPALATAWQRFADLDFNAQAVQNSHRRLRATVIVLSVIATTLAVAGELIANLGAASIIPELLRVGLIFVPIAGSLVLAFANKFYPGEYWLALRTGAEEIRKEIYLYRTLLQTQTDRHLWLNDRLADIQRQVTETFGGNIALKPYAGQLPPYYSADDPATDPGFNDLLPDDYLRYRLQDQLQWHTTKVNALAIQRRQLQIWIFFFGGLGTFFAAFGSPLTILVALTASLAAAFTAWLELAQHDAVISNYNQLITELKIIQDHWRGLTLNERTGDEFFKLVIATEKVLWSQHTKFISEMRKAVAELQGQAPDSLDEMAKTPAPPALDAAVWAQAQSAGVPATRSTAETSTAASAAAEPAALAAAPTGAPHAFVVMPFGRKQDAKGRWLDFDSIYQQLIKPALLEAGFEPFRADEETVSGDILTDMFQELLLADLVVADLSIDNANAFYELGVRHALRKRGVVHIQSGRAYMPFDVFNVRTIPYHTGENGKPDPDYLAKDVQTIAKVAHDTWASDQERIHSPIFNLLTGLPEPNRKALRTPLAAGYWREYNIYQERVDIARRQNYIGDVLLLTEEVRNPLIREEAIGQAAKSLSGLGHHTLALQQYRRGLEINPRNMAFRREEAFELGRLQRQEEAVVKLERLTQENPGDPEARAFLGRLYKDMWVAAWQNSTAEAAARLKAAYEASFLLKRSIDTYLAGFRLDQTHSYSGINAYSLSMLLDHLDRQVGETTERDPEVELVRQQLPTLSGAVRFSLAQAVDKNPNDFWAFASLGDMAVTTAKNPAEVTRAYRRALALGSKSVYAVRSVLAQLQILQALAFRPEHVDAGIAVLQEALQQMYQLEKPASAQADYDPVQVFLCSGHMIDRPNRPEPRFPLEMEAEARQKIEAALDKLQANANDMVITPGVACGGDILFIEACLKRGLAVDAYLPFPEAAFIEESVRFAGSGWVERFYQIRQHPRVTVHLQPDRVGPVPPGDNPYERNIRWALYSTLCYGIDRVRLIVLWDGKGGDGPGGTGYMVREVRQLGGIVEHLDTTKFAHWQKREPAKEIDLS